VAIRRDIERGAAALEFAIVMIPLFVLLFGIIDFALALNAQQAVTAAAREGVRALALGHPEDVETRADSAGAPIPAAELNSSITQTCVPGSAGKVTVTHVYSFLTPIPSFVPGLGASMTLTGKGEMRCGG
jgi:Flp pilus assembly protein TadG